MSQYSGNWELASRLKVMGSAFSEVVYADVSGVNYYLVFYEFQCLPEYDQSVM